MANRPTPLIGNKSRCLFLASALYICLSSTAQDSDTAKVDLDKLNQQLENPLSRFWSLIIQENLSFYSGELVDGYQTVNVLNFQPSLPVPIAKSKMLLVRPVFPLVTAPTSANGDHETGLGDINVFSLFGPDKKDGVIWGIGVTAAFNTAKSEFLGTGKNRLGPAIMVLSLTKKYSIGTIIQHWNSISGDPNRPETTNTEIQYIIRKQIRGKAMSIGMGPTISINWEAEPENRINFPIGLGFTKTIKWGNTPWKLRFEPQYAVIRQEDIGPEWNIRIQIAPIIKSPFL